MSERQPTAEARASAATQPLFPERGESTGPDLNSTSGWPPGQGTVESPAEQALVTEVLWLSRNVLGLTFGMMFAAILFVATNILVLKGGPHPGRNLQLLSQFFPGYTVTFLGSFVGLFYAFVVGYTSGFAIAAVYNRVANWRWSHKN